MHAIINVELDDKLYPGANIKTKYNGVIAAVRSLFIYCIGEVCETEYIAPHGDPVITNTAVISVEFAGSKEAFEFGINTISEVFNQDCVAVLYDDGEGKLVGPRAEAWGEFNPSYFTLPRIYQHLKEAA